MPSHYVNQWWNIVNSNLRNKLQWNVKPNFSIFNLENAYECGTWWQLCLSLNVLTVVNSGTNDCVAIYTSLLHSIIITISHTLHYNGKFEKKHLKKGIYDACALQMLQGNLWMSSLKTQSCHDGIFFSHWWHYSLSSWQPVEPSVMTNLAWWQLLVFITPGQFFCTGGVGDWPWPSRYNLTFKKMSGFTTPGNTKPPHSHQGPISIWRLSFPGMGIPMLKIRGSWELLIFNMGIPILVRRHLYIETASWEPWVPRLLHGPDCFMASLLCMYLYT